MKQIVSGAFSVLFLTAFIGESSEGKTDFAHEVVPILKRHCVECHGGEESKGGFSLNTKRLFLDSEAAVPGNAANSLFIELIEESDPDLQMPPSKKKQRVSPAEVATLKTWINDGMPWESGFTFGGKRYEPPFQPHRPELPPVSGNRNNPIDRFVDAYFESRNLPRPAPLDDAAFLRRVSLDLIGLIPTANETESFLKDDSPEKRSGLIGELLADDVHYSDHWLTFWNDLLRNDYTGTGFITKGRTQISAWLYESLLYNKPFDDMVRELIAPPNPKSAGFINGIKWRGNVSAGQSLPIQFSQSISQSFLGINMKCASCHDSFIDRWTLEEAYGLAAIFSEEPLEIHRCDKSTGKTAQVNWLFPEIGNVDASLPRNERLKQLGNLMTHPKNGRTPRTIVNRLWGQLMGRGIVHPLDAMQSEPWDEDLLDFLAADFQDHGYNLKRTLRLIASSQAYQSKVNLNETTGEGRNYQFVGPETKRMTAEQFVDAIWQITGTAPSSFDAPIVRGRIDEAAAKAIGISSTWIWTDELENENAPAGAKALLKKNFKLADGKTVLSGGIVATADNSFVLYLNNSEIVRGDNWTQLRSAPLRNQFRPGNNQILFAAQNGGDSPNRAGAFCALRIVYTDGSSDLISADSTWESSTVTPKGNRPNLWKTRGLPWKPATTVSLDVWSQTIDPQIGLELSRASAGVSYPVRASLVKNDFLMRTLGRPNRDQIVTSRPSELTTLEALELTNNEDLANSLRRGAEKLVSQSQPPTQLVDSLYLSMLSRFPSAEEKAILTSVLTEDSGPETITDILWSLVMTPEFLLIR